MQKPSKFLTFLTTLVTILFSLSAAIAVPILWRGWYYSQIGSLRLVEATGFSQEAIRAAFDQVMDFLVKDAPFSTGPLKWSASGMSHFADCKILFRLDFVILTVTALLLAVLFLSVLISPRFRRKFALNPPLLALIVTAVVLLLLGVWAFVDFDSLFTAFHTLFFPGKTNWLFDYRTDEIILVLPEVFWARTAALAAALTLLLEGLLSLLWRLLTRRSRPESVYEELLKMR